MDGNNFNERIASFDEFSPTKMIVRTKNVFIYLKKKRIWIVLIACAMGCIGGLIAFNKDTKYKAEISFAIDEEKNQHNKSEFSEFSVQLGLAPIDGGNVFNSINNINELIKSRLLIEKTLRSYATEYRKDLLFIDFFLDSLDYRKEWTKKNPNRTPKFNSPAKDSSQVIYENGLVKNAYKVLTSEILRVNGKGKGTTITSVVCETENQAFSKYFLKALIAQAMQYYIDSRTERSRTNLAIIEKRTDSIKQAYVQSLYGRASFQDADINLVRETFSVPGEKKQTDVQILRSAYIDLSRNLELAKTSLINNTPTIQIIDTPVLPLDSSHPSVLKQFILFMLIGAFIGLLLFIFIYIVKKFQALFDESTEIDEASPAQQFEQ